MKYDDSALTLALHLLQIRAVKLSPQAPFTCREDLHPTAVCGDHHAKFRQA